MRLLEPYGDDALIYIGVELKQGYVGFVDGEEDKNIKDKYMFVLKSDALNDWYKGDIMELGGGSLMSEKRFEFYSDEYLIGVLDTVTGRTLNSFEIVDCLNEQQAEIDDLKEENEQLRQANRTLGDNLKQEEEENVNEYNALLKENEQLKEENEDFRQRIKELQRSREYWIQDNNRLTKKNNELIAKIDFLERVIDGDV